MKYVNKGNLIALLFVSAFAGDIALANELETKPGLKEIAAEVQADLELSRDAFYQEFRKTHGSQDVAEVSEERKWQNSIYFPVVPEAKTVAHRL